MYTTLINAKKVFAVLLMLAMLPNRLLAQHAGQVMMANVPSPSSHYTPEYTFDKATNPEAWKRQKKGLNVSFSSIDELFLRSEVPQIIATTTWQKAGWRGERLNAQILVWSPDSIDQVRVTLNDLKGSDGKIISKENISVQLVRYVLSNIPMPQQMQCVTFRQKTLPGLCPTALKTLIGLVFPAIRFAPYG